ncbi:hypothetical protein HanRHA438_Chr11g0512951 [Helianthus annuus]|nr:hypothetical protein HanRHA438_Chr11g0512951 [Helianthus annuus]
MGCKSFSPYRIHLYPTSISLYPLYLTCISRIFTIFEGTFRAMTYSHPSKGFLDVLISFQT